MQSVGEPDEQHLLAVVVDLDGMVNDQIGGTDGVDPLRVAAQFLDGVAHRREVDDGGDASERS